MEKDLNYYKSFDFNLDNIKKDLEIENMNISENDIANLKNLNLGFMSAEEIIRNELNSNLNLN